MTENYKQAVLEAKKLRETAEQDARNKIIEHVSPIIKRMITKEAVESSKFLFGEVDSDPNLTSDPVGGVNPTDLSSMMGGDSGAESADPMGGGGMPGMPPGMSDGMSAPISASGELGGMPMPDNEGKITLDFNQLFNMTGAANGSAPANMMANSDGGDLNGLPDNLSPADPGAVGETPSEAPPIADPMAGGPPPGTEAPADPAMPPAAPQATPPAAGAPMPPAAPTQPAPEEENLAPKPIAEKVEDFRNDVGMVAEKISIVLSKGNKSLLVKESIKSKLFSLCENADTLVSEGVFTERQAKIVENKLNFLYTKLNEVNDTSSYKEDEGKKMTTLKEFAAKLFEEDALGPVLVPKATAHAEKVSGVAPGIDLFKEGEDMDEDELNALAESMLAEEAVASTAFGDGHASGSAQTKSPSLAKGKSLATEKGGAGIAESAPASTQFGDGQKATGAQTASPKVHSNKALADEPGSNTILEFDEKELKEAISRVRKENFARKLASVKEEALKGTDAKGHLKSPKVPTGDQAKAKPEGGKAQKIEDIKEEFDFASLNSGAEDDAEDMEVDADMDADMDSDTGSDEVELKFSIDIEDLEALLSGSVTDFVAEPSDMDADAVDDSDDMDSDDMDSDSIEITDDSDDEVLMDAPEEEVDESPMMTSPSPMHESRKSKTKLTEAKLIKKMKSQLMESQLLTAKALYVSKFAVREDLSSAQKKKIAGYFDKTTTLAEAKETYAKIKKIVTESASTNKLSGSASRPTTTGSARVVLEEGANNASDTIEPSRWMLLAGIGNKNQNK